jgi:ATP-dependent Clp protease ATP-binding subunit ClpA
MLEHFTKEARAVVVAAESEAARTHATEVGPEHLLLGLGALLTEVGIDAETLRRDIVRSDGLDADALATLGIDLEEVRRQAEETFGEGALGRAAGGRGRPRFGRAAKKTLERTLREALAMGDRALGPRHILLALTWDDHAMDLVGRQGVHRDEVRTAIVAGAHGP